MKQKEKRTYGHGQKCGDGWGSGRGAVEEGIGAISGEEGGMVMETTWGGECTIQRTDGV